MGCSRLSRGKYFLLSVPRSSSRHSTRSQFYDTGLIGRTLNGGRTFVRGTLAITRRPWGFAIAQAEGYAAFLMRVADPRLSVIAPTRTRIASPFQRHRSYGGTGNNHSCCAAALTTLFLSLDNFPDIKTLDQLDWSALKSVSPPKIMELASCA